MMATKAARGAGFCIGIAEDIGAAAVYLVDLSVLCTALGTDAPMRCLAAVDALICGEAQGEQVDDVPALFTACVSAWNARCVPAQKVAHVVPEPLGACDVEPQIWAELSTWAKKTYVPASEASRFAGAGAGLTDND